jgi:hypothetical protein
LRDKKDSLAKENSYGLGTLFCLSLLIN